MSWQARRFDRCTCGPTSIEPCNYCTAERDEPDPVFEDGYFDELPEPREYDPRDRRADGPF